MANMKKAKALGDDNLENVAGGFAGKEKYSHEEYNKAGVSWDHNTWSKDEYYYNGVKINQKQAEEYTEYFNKTGRQYGK